jgi:hypothetical protein
MFLLLAAPLAACANGDFGRLKPQLVDDDIHAWVGREAAEDSGVRPSKYPLTDDERQMRDLAYPLIEPPYDRARFYSIVSEYGVTRGFIGGWPQYDRAAYAKRLLFTPYRSATARYTQLNTDIRNDVERIPSFFMVARRVLDLDRKREKSLGHVSSVNAREVKNATSRVAENTLLTEWVQQSLADRCETYSYALERLVIGTPTPMAIEVERSLTLLRTRMAEYQLIKSPEFVGPRPVAALGLPVSK